MTPASHQNGSSESRAGDVLLLPTALAASWTIAYQLVLVARWPARSIVWCFFPIAIITMFLLARMWKATNATPGSGYRFHRAHLLLLILGVGCAVTVLFVRRPNQDDIVYFHRALAQLFALGRPILTRQTSVDMDAAAFSPVHLSTSHEMLMAFLGHYLRIDPLYCYQVVGHAFTAFCIPFVLYWSVRRLGLDRWSAAAGALTGIVFLLLDGVGASFGNTAFARMWQGKAIVWILFLPITLSLTYRFLREGNIADVIWLVLLGVAGVGLSSSALYLLPAVMGCSALSFLIVELVYRARRDDVWKQLRRGCLLGIALIYPVGVLALLQLNVIPKPIDLRGFGPEYIPWDQGLAYVVGGPNQHLRNIVIFIAVPLLIVRGKAGLFLFLYVCAVWLLCLNPLLAHWWMRHILALCYFRLNYLLPLPLLCATLPAGVTRLFYSPDQSAKNRLVTESALFAVIAVFFYSYRSLSIMPDMEDRWKSPRDYQLIKANTDFAQAAGSYIAQSKLLAPNWAASCELPLLFPRMKVVAPRLAVHYFANAGNAKEGALRVSAQRFVEGEKAQEPRRAAMLPVAFRRVIQSGRANAVAAPESESERVLTALQSIDPGWHRVVAAGGLVLMLPPGTEPGNQK